MGIGIAVRSFVRALTDRSFSDSVGDLLAGTVAPPPPPPSSPLQILALLQRDGRLIDFLYESIDGYADDQIGAAVRTIHADCKKTLDKYLQLAPVVATEEDAVMDVPAGFDARQIQLTGNVKGSPPFKGTVVHRGWRAQKLGLPPTDGNADPSLVAPAEVTIA